MIYVQDSQFVLNELGVENTISVGWLHQTGTTDTVTRAYYSQLTTRQVNCYIIYLSPQRLMVTLF